MAICTHIELLSFVSFKPFFLNTSCFYYSFFVITFQDKYYHYKTELNVSLQIQIYSKKKKKKLKELAAGISYPDKIRPSDPSLLDHAVCNAYYHYLQHQKRLQTIYSLLLYRINNKPRLKFFQSNNSHGHWKYTCNFQCTTRRLYSTFEIFVKKLINFALERKLIHWVIKQHEKFFPNLACSTCG